MTLDLTDKAVLLRLQVGFPLHTRPFRMLGDALGVPEQEIMQRVQRLKDEGYIRTIRATFDVERMGAVSTLVAACVEPDRIEQVAAALNEHPEITHNYERRHHYNLWFTIIADSRARIDELLEQTRGLEGVKEVLEVPTLRRFKIAAVFDARRG
jgi:DNA-binding Lrp family transcriptional regulator